MTDWRLKRRTIAASMLCVLAGSTAWAQQAPPPEDLEALKRMIQEVISQNEELKRRVQELEAAMTKRAQAPAEAAKPAAPAPAAPVTPEPVPQELVKAGKAPFGKIQLGGAIEVEAASRREARRNPISHERSSDLALGTAEFDFEADVVDWGKAELSLQWGAATTETDAITLNEALLTLAKPSVLPVYLKTGRGVVPFGISTGTSVAARLEETLTITGPLTLDVFESKEDYALLGVRGYGLHAGAYVFNGTTDNRVRGKQLEHWGATISYGLKTDLVSFDVGVDWIDSVFDSDGLTAEFAELQTRRRKGYAPGVGTRPEAWQVELGYTTSIFGVRPFGAFNYSETSGLPGTLSTSTHAGFPKNRKLGAVGAFLSDNVRVALEYNSEEDTSTAFFGTGKDSQFWTLRLTYEW
ncbi:MAG: hypothetical protein DME12_02075 [Candidatus Rokuibacteriota bacterium]|nr:MAG: hypothetical protein DME12_02075 [Candidatus Rokubacteria bacterium]